MRVAICDDEKNIREDIKRIITDQCVDCHVDLYGSGESLLAACEDYDIYFLDIQMSGMTGMETAARIRTREAAESQSESIIIFITSFADYWGDAFDVKAFHYLVKPVDKVKFTAVFTRAAAGCLDKKVNSEKHILIKRGDLHHKVYLSDIFYLESQNKKVAVYSANGVIEHYGKMQDLEGVLGNSFFRCHRCYIVNMEHITKYNATTIWLNNDISVFLAQKKYNEFVKAYLNYAKSGGLINE